MKTSLKSIIVVIVLCYSIPAYSATWYVNNTATGSNNGSSWTNAWNGFSRIVWGGSGVKAGDTLYISGGTISKVYNETLTIRTSGSAGSPITISVGQDTGHNGQVIIDSQNTRTKAIDSSSASYITVTGNVGGSRNLVLINLVCSTTNIDTTGGAAIWGGGHTIWEYIEVNHAMNGFYCAAQSNQEIRNCYFHDITGDYGLRLNNSSANSFTDYLVHDNIILINQDSTGGTTGGDGIQLLQSATIYNNTIRSVAGTSYYGQHADAIQAMGKGWVKFYNNYCANQLNSTGKFGPITGTGVIWEETYIYNNVFAVDDPNLISQYERGLEIYQDGASVATLRNLYVMNNTFVDLNFIGINTYVGSATTVQNVQIINNIFFNVGRNASGTCITWDNNKVASGVTIDYNLVSAGSDGGTTLKFNGSTLTQAHPRTGTPFFLKYYKRNTGSDFHLSSTDNAAKGQGIDLSTYFATDKDGLLRSGAWDLGAYKFGSTQLGVQIPTGLKIP
jgi:hypothetical protein